MLQMKISARIKLFQLWSRQEGKPWAAEKLCKGFNKYLRGLRNAEKSDWKLWSLNDAQI